MNKALLSILCLLLFSRGSAQNSGDSLAVWRIRYFYQLKARLAGKAWPGFGSPKYNEGLAYYTPYQTYIIDPDGSLERKVVLTTIYRSGKLKISKTARLDTGSFHMATAYEDRDNTILWYHNAVMLCSDYETTQKYVQDVPDIQTWATMVMHEYFHGFQLRHPAFIRFANDSISVSNTHLQSYYDNYPWFRESIEKENKLLLECLNEMDVQKIKLLLKKYLATRNLRLKHFSEVEKFELGPQEDFLEKMEGSARYMEYQLYLLCKKLQPYERVGRLDTAYKPGAFKNFKLTDKPWMYESSSVRYFYSVGFNIFRLLDKLHVSYKQHLFDDKDLTLNKLLIGQLK